jgi:hypothetical protein
MDDGNLADDLPDWWPYPVQCGHGLPWSPGIPMGAATGPSATWSDETMPHGMQKVRGSNPLSFNTLSFNTLSSNTLSSKDP